MAKRRTVASGSSRSRTRPSRTIVEPAFALRYIEPSALVAALLERDVKARAAIRGPGRRVTSSLTLAEAERAVVRARVTDRITASEERAAVRALQVFARRCDVMAVTDAVLVRVGRPFPVEPVRTLDAVHLATAEQLGEPPALITIVTRDGRVRDNAIALGYAVEQPPAPLAVGVPFQSVEFSAHSAVAPGLSITLPVVLGLGLHLDCDPDRGYGLVALHGLLHLHRCRDVRRGEHHARGDEGLGADLVDLDDPRLIETVISENNPRHMDYRPGADASGDVRPHDD